MADEIRLSDNIEAEFHPLVVIVAHDPGRYASFQALFHKNSFKCEVFQELPPEFVESPPPGAIFFVSFNLKSHDVPQLVRRLESRNNLCIVFAESEGVENAAKLSSAKMTQTLQHPYTEKNFLMAVQTIVKKRRVQYEKDQRKQTVLDRRKGMAEGNVQVDTESPNRIFKNESARSNSDVPLIFEERALGKKFSAVQEGHGYVSGHSHFMRDRNRRGLRAVQEGLVGATYSFADAASQRGRLKMAVASGAKGIGDVATSESRPAAMGGIASGGSRAVANGGVIVQHANAPELRAVAGGAGSSKSHMAIESKVKLESKDSPQDAETGAERVKREGEVLVGYGKKDLRAIHDPLVMGSVDDRHGADVKPAEQPPSAFEEKTKLAGSIVVPTWALIAAASIGILFCLWFLFQLLFHRH